MGRHSAPAFRPLTPGSITAEQLTEKPRPGSRRARRLAQQAQKKTTASAFFHANPYAEYMNENLVISKVAVSSPLTVRRIFGRSKLAVLGLVAATSGLTVMAGASSLNNFAPADGSNFHLGAASAPMITKVDFTVQVDGKTQKVEAIAGTSLAKALKAADILVQEADEVSLPLDTPVKAGLEVKIVRITYKMLTEDFTQPFETVEKADANLPAGERVVEQHGVEGAGTRTVRITYRDGAETAREVQAESYTKAPVQQIVRVGAGQAAAPASGPVDPGSARAIAKSMLASYGWGEDQFGYLDALWQRESKWNHTASNGSSGAYGIPQALPGSKMASAGADWRTNPSTQISWGLGYIKGRYGSPAAAWAHSQRVGWY